MVEIEVMLTVGQTLSAVGYLAGREGGKVTIGQVRTEERKGETGDSCGLQQSQSGVRNKTPTWQVTVAGYF